MRAPSSRGAAGDYHVSCFTRSSIFTQNVFAIFWSAEGRVILTQFEAPHILSGDAGRLGELRSAHVPVLA